MHDCNQAHPAALYVNLLGTWRRLPQASFLRDIRSRDGSPQYEIVSIRDVRRNR